MPERADHPMRRSHASSPSRKQHVRHRDVGKSGPDFGQRLHEPVPGHQRAVSAIPGHRCAGVLVAGRQKLLPVLRDRRPHLRQFEVAAQSFGCLDFLWCQERLAICTLALGQPANRAFSQIDLFQVGLSGKRVGKKLLASDPMLIAKRIGGSSTLAPGRCIFCKRPFKITSPHIGDAVAH